jgi:hypothetical protein
VHATSIATQSGWITQGQAHKPKMTTRIASQPLKRFHRVSVLDSREEA